MKTYILGLMAVICYGLPSLHAQESGSLTPNDSIVKSSWMVGAGFNMVDDSGDAFNDFTTIKDQWNAVAFPSRLSIGRYFENGLGVEIIATYNRYKAGNTIDGSINPENKNYYGFDSRLSYDLNKIVGETGWFDPYVGVGLGYTDANDTPRATHNAVIGFRTWISERWGLDFSSSGKWSFGTEATNHIQHAAGVVYRFDIEKELSKKGEEKLALMQEMEQESQRVSDSILASQKAEEAAKALADRLAREKEQADRLAEERAKLDKEKKPILDLQQAVDDLGLVYFEFNSSYLNSDSMATLDQLAMLLQENAALNLKISAHADSRGTQQYNLWLSERRAKRTLEYLLSKGIDATRLQSIGMGEKNLANHCSDGVHCNSQEHRANRRSEFKVVLSSAL